MKKAIFLDRDGTIIKVVYNPITSLVDTVNKPEEVQLTPGIAEVLNYLKSLGYLLIIISNQPRVGLKKLTLELDEAIDVEFQKQLDREGIVLDKVYYCTHHPFAEIEEYRKKCDCRKPGIKFFKDAEKEFEIDLNRSYMIGDSVIDIMAGHAAGTKTILIANIQEASYLEIIEKQLGSIKPTFLIKKPKDIRNIIKL